MAPALMISEAFISQAEEQFLGIPVDITDGFRDMHIVPDSDGVEALREIVKRDRAGTVTVHNYTKRQRAGTYSRVDK